MIKLRLKNFQSHKESILELAPFTAIVGSSSSGKSAIIRAVKTLLYNLPSKSFIRHGSKKLEIELILDEDKILYTRDASISYEINDSGILKAVGRDQLPQVSDLGFKPLDIDKRKYYPQISQQFDTPFLISFTDSEISKILSSLSQAGKVKQAKNKMARDASEMRLKLGIRQNDRESLQKQLVYLGDVEGQNNRIQGILERQNKVISAQKAVTQAMLIKDKIASECSELPVPSLPDSPTLLIELSKLLYKPIVDIPDLSELDSMFKILMSLIGFRDKIASIESEVVTKYYEDELSVLETQIHNLSTVCQNCGQKLPK